MKDIKFSIIVLSVGTSDGINVPVVLLESGKSMHKRFIVNSF